MKTLAICIFVSIAAIILLIVAAEYFPLKDKGHERVFNARVLSKMNDNEQKIFLRDLTDFHWDKVCYFSTQNGEGGMSYPTPAEVIGREFEGYIPESSCDTFGHSDFFFYSDSTAQFIKFKFCGLVNLCRAQSVGGNLHCCSKSAFLTYRSAVDADNENYQFYLKDEQGEEK